MSRVCLIALFLALATFAQETPAYDNEQQDSVVAEYAKQAEYFEKSGNFLSKAGNGLFIGGGALLVLTAVDCIYLLKKNAERNAKIQDESEKGDKTTKGEKRVFRIITLAGFGCIFGGIVFKVDSNKRKHRAKFYREQLQNYREKGQSVSLELMPTFNPIHKAFGGNLLLDF